MNGGPGSGAKVETHTNRLKALDVLRAIAVLLVFGRHFNVFEPYYRGGWSGVDLFFVLSGFLISGLLFTGFKKSGRIQMGRFLIRRGFKIYPPFYVLMGWTVLMFAVHQGHLRERPFLSELFFLQSYIQGMWGHTWSLAVEEHFYLLLPVLLIVLCRLSRDREDPFRPLPWIFLVVAAGSLSLRFVMCGSVPGRVEALEHQSHMNIDSLLFGVVLSYFYHFRPVVFDRLARIPAWLLLPVSLCLIVPCFFTDLYTSVFIQSLGHPMLYLGYGGLLLVALSPRALPGRHALFGRVADSLAFVGRYSYSIYLWHAPVGSWAMVLLGRRGLLPASRLSQFLIYAAGSLALGVLMARLVEIPALKIRDRLFPSLSGPLAAPAGKQRAAFPMPATVPEAG